MQRDARHEAVVQMLLDRAVEDREAREKRQLRYKQSLDSSSDTESSVVTPDSPTRLHKFRTKVPCRVTREARVLLDQLKKQFYGSSISFLEVNSRRQAVMLNRGPGTQPLQIGWIEQVVQSDPKRCNVRNQGLTVETDGGTMLLLRFHYPRTATRMSARSDEFVSDTTDEVAPLDFAELRTALDLRPADQDTAPRLVWLSRSELETMDALASRDYEGFYTRFKLELQAGIWSALSTLLASTPASHAYRGAHYSVVREADTRHGTIYQRTVDDNGTVVDTGLDRTYEASAATDIVLLYLASDILADFADIYFSLEDLSAADTSFFKDQFFALIRHFWASTDSLGARYGSELPTLERMARRAVPTPHQAMLLQQDWINLRQVLLDRFGEGGRKLSDLVAAAAHGSRSRPAVWPFTSFRAGEVNVGLRIVYRQLLKDPVDENERETTIVRGLAATSNLGLETECCESSRELSARMGAPTRLVEIQNIVMVAEPLPTPAEIDRSWVSRHDWILSKVLLDESFREDLSRINEDTPSAGRERLYEHFRANLLHYQRAIWLQEDPQQRSMRYRKLGRKVALEWRFELASGSALTIDELSHRLRAANVDGQFAAYSSGRAADLDEVIDPAGPIGYYGNFAIHHMRPEFAGEELFSMLHFFKSPYLRPNLETGEAEVVDPLEADIIQTSAPVEKLRPAASALAMAALADGYQLILDSTRCSEILNINGGRALNAVNNSLIVPNIGAQPMLVAGARARVRTTADARAQQHVIVAASNGTLKSNLHVGGEFIRFEHAHTERMILAQDNAEVAVQSACVTLN